MEAGNGLFNITTPDETWRQDSSAATTGVVVMKVYVDDVDKHFTRAKAEGAKIISEPQDGFWGGRVYRVIDHEGHRHETIDFTITNLAELTSQYWLLY